MFVIDLFNPFLTNTMKKRKKQKKRWRMPFPQLPFCKRYLSLSFFLLLSFFTRGYGQTTVAALPFELKINGSSSLKNVAGLKCATSLDFFYSGDGSVRFSNNGDYMILRFDKPAESVTLKKTTGGTGSTFLIAGSADGNHYETIEELTVTATAHQLLSTVNPIDVSFRYVKIAFTKVSNVGVSLVQIKTGESGSTAVTPPSFSLAEGNYMGPQFVTITGEAGTTLYYTKDGTTPTKNSVIYTGEAIEISSTLTLQAIAYDPNNCASPVSSATYTILPAENALQMYGTAFYESFDQNSDKGGNDDKWSGSIASSVPGLTDHPGWSLQNGFTASKCIVLGTSSQGKGVATTPVLGISGNAKLRFRAAAWNTTNEMSTCTLKISNSAGRLQTSSASKPAQSITLSLEKGKFNTYEVEITGAVETSSKISFSAEPTGSKNARFFLDEIRVFYPIKDETEETSVSALSGKWDIESLCRIPELVSEKTETALVLNTQLELLDDMVVDNTGGNPNLIVYSVTPLPVLHAVNAAGDKLNGKTELHDTYPFDARKDLEGEVYLKRSFAGVDEGVGGWQSLCLPFTPTKITGNNAEYLPYTEWNKTKPKDKGFFWLKTTHTNHLTNDIDTDASTIKANTPYIIAFPNLNNPDYPLLTLKEPLEFTFYGNGIETTGKDQPFPMKDWWFQPTFRRIETENCYVLNQEGDQFERVSIHANETEPFRPYLIYRGSSENSPPPTFVIGKDNGPSGTPEIQKKAEELCIVSLQGSLLLHSPHPNDVSIYTLQGKQIRQLRTSSGSNYIDLPPGIYFVNEKKAIVY